MKKLLAIKLFLSFLLFSSVLHAQTNTARMLAGTNAQTGTSYTFVCTDATKLVTFNNASPVSVTLFAATDACSGPGIMFSVKNIGAGAVTITPVSGTINGAASLTLSQDQGADIWNDGTNYTAQGSTSSGPPPAGFPRLDQVTNQNQNRQFNQGSATIGFTNGPGMDLSGETTPLVLPLIAGCTPSANGQICFDTLGANIHGFSGIVSEFDPATVTSGNIAGFLNVGGHWILQDLGPPSSTGGTVITATITNITENDTICWDAASGEFINCSTGVPINLQTGTSYTIDGVNDRGTAIVSSNVGAQAYTLPQLNETNNTAANFFWLGMNKNTGTVTVNATAPDVFDSTGTGSETIQEGENVSFLTDPSTGIIYPKFSPGRVTAAGPLSITRNPYGMQIGCPTCGTGTGNVSGSFTAGKVPVASGANSLIDGSILDDGTHAARNDNGYDINSLGRFLWWAPNNTVTGTTLNKAVCDDGTGKGIICPSASSTTNNVLGSAVAANGAAPGASGSTGVCTIGFCPYIFDNAATANHYAQSSSTIDGDLHDVGTTTPTNGQSYWFVYSGNSGAGTAAVIRNISPSELNAASISGGNGRNLQMQVNGSATTKNIKNLNSSTPAPGGGFLATTWATSAAGNIDSIISKIAITGNTNTVASAGTVSGTNPACSDGSGNLKADGTCPSASGVSSVTGDATIFSNSGSTGAVTLTKATQNPNQVLAGPVASGGTNVVQSVTNSTNSSTTLATVINGVGATHMLIIAVYLQNSATVVSSSGGETVTLAQAASGGFWSNDVYVICSATGGNETITASGYSPGLALMHIYEVSGNATSSCKDTGGSSAAPGGSPLNVSTTTGGSVAQPGELVFWSVNNGGGIPGATGTVTFGPGYTKVNETQNTNGSQSILMATGIGNSNTGLSGAQTATASMASSGFNLDGVIITFKLNTPSSTAQPTFRSLVTADLPAPLNGTPIGSSFNVSPVTVNANTTSDQNLQSLILPAGFFNSLGKTLRVWNAGTYSTPIASTATLTYKMKLCTVSGCGSGTVVTLTSWTTSANPGNVTTNPWNADSTIITQATGTSGFLEVHGNLVIDLGATAGLADSVFSDTNTASVGSIDLSQLLYLQTTVSFSSGSASNIAVQRQMSAPTLY